MLFVLLLLWRPFIFEAVAVYLANSAMGVIYQVVWQKMAIHQQEAFQPLLKAGARFPVAERLASDVFSLPLCPEISNGEAQTVLDELDSVLQADAAQVGR